MLRMPRRFLTIFACSLLFLVLPGCETSLSPGPSDATGTWSYEASLSASQSGVTCEVASATLELQQMDEVLAGTIRSGTLTCTDGDGAEHEVSLAGEALLNGRVSGRTVDFRFPLPDPSAEWNHAGQIAESTMSGSSTITGTVDGLSVDVSGNWSADRTSP